MFRMRGCKSNRAHANEIDHNLWRQSRDKLYQAFLSLFFWGHREEGLVTRLLFHVRPSHISHYLAACILPASTHPGQNHAPSGELAMTPGLTESQWPFNQVPSIAPTGLVLDQLAHCFLVSIIIILQLTALLVVAFRLALSEIPIPDLHQHI